MKERIYLGGFEIYREYNGKGEKVVSERETLHSMDDQQRIALMETKTFEDKDGEILAAQKPLIRYQLGNHLGSAAVEMDSDGKVISYEEYYPYGNTACQAVVNSIEVSLKRYRYTGKERDEESGLYYHGTRYYATWLGRWTSCDPIGIEDNSNLYSYVKCQPIKFIDPNGESGILVPKTRREFGFSITINEIERYQKMSAKEKFDFNQKVWDREFNLDYIRAAQRGDLIEMPSKLNPLNDPGFVEKLKTAWDKSSTNEKIAMVGASGGLAPYVGDYVSLGSSATIFFREPSWSNAEDVVLDAIGAALPFVPALGTLNKLEEAKNAKKTSKLLKQKYNSPIAKEILPPGPRPPDQVTKPTGRKIRSNNDASALKGNGIEVRRRLRTYDEDHHLFVQEYGDWFADKGIDIDRYTVRLTWGDHSAIHSLDWNSEWRDWIAQNNGASPTKVFEKLREMEQRYGLTNETKIPYGWGRD
jgi:RHS repeat-associated protein